MPPILSDLNTMCCKWT